MLFDRDRLSLGLVLPAERRIRSDFEFETQLSLASRADRAGFGALWVREVPLNSEGIPIQSDISILGCYSERSPLPHRKFGWPLGRSYCHCATLCISQNPHCPSKPFRGVASRWGLAPGTARRSTRFSARTSSSESWSSETTGSSWLSLSPTVRRSRGQTARSGRSLALDLVSTPRFKCLLSARHRSRWSG